MEVVIDVDTKQMESKINHTLSNKIIHYFLESSQESLKTNIADRTPVKTNNLATSWTPRLGQKEMKVTTDVHYARFVETGTRYFRGRHMAEFGAEQFKQKIRPLLANAFLKAGV